MAWTLHHCVTVRVGSCLEWHHSSCSPGFSLSINRTDAAIWLKQAHVITIEYEKQTYLHVGCLFNTPACAHGTLAAFVSGSCSQRMRGSSGEAARGLPAGCWLVGGKHRCFIFLTWSSPGAPADFLSSHASPTIIAICEIHKHHTHTEKCVVHTQTSSWLTKQHFKLSFQILFWQLFY